MVQNTSIRNCVVRIAYLKGYRVNEFGYVVSPLGKVRKLQIQIRKTGKKYSKYYRFNVPVNNGDMRSVGVMVHRLVAYQKYGEKALRKGIHTRHWNGKSLDNRPSNILLGSQSDNMMDRPVEERRRHAAKGNRTHSSKFIQQLRLDHSNGLSYNNLRIKYGLPKSTLSYYLSSSAKRASFSCPL